MACELDAIKTPVDKTAMFTAMANGWIQIFSEMPTREAIILMMSQWALETGHGDSMWCYNLGNVKAQTTGAYDHCFFACNELLKTSVAHKMAADDPVHAKVTADRSDGNSWIWFYPKHPYSCFRAHRTLNEGVLSHILLMNKRFTKAWPFIAAGDPTGFCHALKQQNYYTADESSYTKGVVRVFSGYRAALSDVPLPVMNTLYDSLKSAEFVESTLLTPTLDEECVIYSPYSNSLLEAA